MQKKQFLMVALMITLGLLPLLFVASAPSDSTDSVKLDIDLVQGNVGGILVYYTLPTHHKLQTGNWEYSLDSGQSWQRIPLKSIKHSPSDFGLPIKVDRQRGVFAWQTQQVATLRTAVPQLQIRVSTYLKNTNSDWLEMSAMRVPRQGHSITTHQGRLYTFGGWNGCRLTASAEFYDVSSEGWYKIDAMPTPRQHLASVTIGEMIYAIGGLGRNGDLAVVEAYDIRLNRWFSKQPMPTPRRALGLAVVDGLIYAIGGHNGTSLSIVEIYDPKTDQWITGQPLPQPRHSMGVTELNGKIYVIGGLNKQTLNSTLVYQPLSNKWETVANLKKPRYGLTAVSHSSLNHIYAIGGTQIDIPNQTDQSQTEAVESATCIEVIKILQPSGKLIKSKWQLFTPLHVGRTYGGSGLVADRLYAIGGNGQSVYSTAESIVLDISTGYAESQPIVLQNDIKAELKSPLPFSTINGNITILGQVNGKSVKRWQVAIASLGSGDFQLISQGQGIVDNHSTDYQLGNWNTEGLSDGFYLIRLQVYHSALIVPNSPAETFSLVRLRADGA